MQEKLKGLRKEKQRASPNTNTHFLSANNTESACNGAISNAHATQAKFILSTESFIIDRTCSKLAKKIYFGLSYYHGCLMTLIICSNGSLISSIKKM